MSSERSAVIWSQFKMSFESLMTDAIIFIYDHNEIDEFDDDGSFCAVF